MDKLNETLLTEITRRIVAVSDPQQIILFGSQARGEAGPDSDSGPVGDQGRGNLTVRRSRSHRSRIGRLDHPGRYRRRVFRTMSAAIVTSSEPSFARLCAKVGCSMSAEQDEAVHTLVADRLRWAQADMTVALLMDDERIAPEIVAFHAQQATEKVERCSVPRQVDFPRTHSIGALLAMCEQAGYIDAQDLIDASSLTRYAVTTRYPGDEEPVSREEAREAATLAAQVFVWGFMQIQESGEKR